ncbi:hypothetical protein [Paracoccus salsus]|uniref:hypothetical protein n=1 Tax=Paracoccus salsus TaxID=2911061 RepID=UPI001F3E0FC1|nr:hypothetical protein [Paracoccus salsus]MCF3974458.1 hypothetical protein [Paracoccus salsus]
MSDSALLFVIIEKDCFIARDMQEGLEAADPACETIRLRDPEEAVELVCGRQPDGRLRTVIITKLSLAQIEDCSLSRLADEGLVEIVVRIGDDTSEAVHRRGWFTLASPFTRDDLSALVVEVQVRAAAA